MMTCIRLLWEFFKTGLFAFGGGMATIPFLQDISVRTGWFTQEQLSDMIAVSESTPGPIGINMATYAGYSAAGAVGAACATVGIVLPCCICIVLVSRILDRFRTNKFVDYAFYGLRAASAGLIAAALFALAKVTFVSSVFRWEYVALAALIFVFTNFVKKTEKWHPLVFILFSAITGIVFKDRKSVV